MRGLWVWILLLGFAAFKTRYETGAAAPIVLAAIAVTGVLAFFAVDTLRTAPATFLAIVVVAALSVVLDFLSKRSRGPLPSAPAIPIPRSESG